MSMGSQLHLLVLALLFTASRALSGADYATSESGADGDHVVTLTAAEFDDAVKSSAHLLVEFYAPWCPHCKVLAPEFGAAATALKQSRVDVVLAKVDATQNKRLAKREGVTGFPTLKWFRKGVAYDYTGGRGRQDIIDWVTRKTSVQVKQLGSASDVEAFRRDKTYVVVAFLGDASGADAAVLQEAAALMEEVIGVVSDQQLAQSVGITPRAGGAPTVAVLRTFEEPVVVLDAPLTADGVVTFALAHRRPALLAFGPTTAQSVLQSPYQVLCFATQEEMVGLQPVLKRAAEALRGEQVLFVTVAADQGNETAQVFHFFGVANDTAPTIRGFTKIDGKTTKLKPVDPADISEGALVAFGRSVLNATAKAYYMSQPPPVSNGGPVTVVTGDTFDSLVLDPNRDVLLEVYAPWCAHCKALEPIYERLARRFRRIDSVVVAKMDGTANEHPALASAVQGYPAILLFPATGNASLAKGAPVLYDGARTVPALTKWLKANTKVPYSLPLKASAAPPKKERASRHEGDKDYDLRRKG